MSKKVSAVVANSTPLSLKDAGYRQAQSEDTTRSLAKYVMDKLPGFPEDISDEAKAELYSGYQLRYAEIHPDIEYVVIDGNYLRADDVKNAPEKAERINLGVNYALSFTQQAFGALANEKSANYNPAIHKIVGEIRTKLNKYCSNKYKNLVRLVKQIQNEGTTRTRTQADLFNIYVDKTFDTMQTRCKTAKTQRGDETANLERFTKAKVAFFAVWNHAE